MFLKKKEESYSEKFYINNDTYKKMVDDYGNYYINQGWVPYKKRNNPYNLHEESGEYSVWLFKYSGEKCISFSFCIYPPKDGISKVFLLVLDDIKYKPKKLFKMFKSEILSRYDNK